MRLFQNQVALVTGAASGIGRALSLALAQGRARVYAADINDIGVKVSVACPGLVRTNIPDRTIYWNVKKEEYLAWLPFQKMMLSPETAAQGILRGVVRNQGIIFCPFSARIAWWVYRVCPGLMILLMRRTLQSFRPLRVEERCIHKLTVGVAVGVPPVVEGGRLAARMGRTFSRRVE